MDTIDLKISKKYHKISVKKFEEISSAPYGIEKNFEIKLGSARHIINVL